MRNEYLSEQNAKVAHFYKHNESLIKDAERATDSIPLYHCNARIVRYRQKYFLVSYNTCIAAFDSEECALYDYLRLVYGYTAISSQHIAKFFRWCEENVYAVREFNRYYKSEIK